MDTAIIKMCIFASKLKNEFEYYQQLKSTKMKKVLLLSLSLVLGLGAFAQKNVIKNDSKAVKMNSKTEVVGTEVTTSAASYAPQASKSVVVNRYQEMEYAETMMTYYDLQSNSWCSNRMVQFENGNVAVTGTMSHEDNQTASDRGTGYNYYDGEDWGDQPEERVEGDLRTGWPTIAQWGANGEILLSHSPIRCWVRETAGEGEWVLKATLPAVPDGYPYSGDDASWPRVATSGDNHNIAHVIADIQHSGTTTEHFQVYYRSEDAVNWTIDYSPLQDAGEETGHYSADAYNITANGHNVAMIYGDDLQSHVVMYKSTDDGLTWTRTVVWENPYYGCDWSEDPCSVFTDTMFGPANTAIAIDNNGVVHVAMSTYEYIHDELGDTYTTWSGRAVDGIYYWNDTQEAPIQSPDGNPHHALRLWWPSGDGYVHMESDSTKWIGFIPMFYDESGAMIEYDHEKFYRESDYFYKFRSGASGMPALSIDPDGNIACAFSVPTTCRESDGKYIRGIIVSYYNASEGYWNQDVDYLQEDIMLMYTESIFTIAADNTQRHGEFWVGYQGDNQIGLYWGSNATQTLASENYIYAVKLIADPDVIGIEETEAQDVVYNIYPNPATDYIMISSAMNANATISFVNLAGQTVKSFNKALTTGENSISIDLESGIYFCTVNANGFSKTTKVVVK